MVLGGLFLLVIACYNLAMNPAIHQPWVSYNFARGFVITWPQS